MPAQKARGSSHGNTLPTLSSGAEGTEYLPFHLRPTVADAEWDEPYDLAQVTADGPGTSDAEPDPQHIIRQPVKNQYYLDLMHIWAANDAGSSDATGPTAPTSPVIRVWGRPAALSSPSKDAADWINQVKREWGLSIAAPSSEDAWLLLPNFKTAEFSSTFTYPAANVYPIRGWAGSQILTINTLGCEEVLVAVQTAASGVSVANAIIGRFNS